MFTQNKYLPFMAPAVIVSNHKNNKFSPTVEIGRALLVSLGLAPAGAGVPYFRVFLPSCYPGVLAR